MSNYRNVLIKIDYISNPGSVWEQNAERKGNFPLRGRKPEQVAHEWIRKLRKEISNFTVVRVTVDGEHHITKAVLQLDVIPTDNLPF
ncbi:hypothetical protein AM500_21310 [Bacillus sp. FJAT-18017]|uniref:hypothetical protein n=1 Tax=Bacillus sp. FJAT-18017 TaxID=1705566 RepID=UPI0006B04A27|nr:hypothetical protein [Bacillus sp. FJAT-18017]ALC92048.1 hypothetical protein AM500_21310 [Bacillus sp. FJAT-18017]